MEECKIDFLTARCDFERTFVGGINTKVYELRPMCDRVFQGWLISSALNTISVCPLARLYLAVNLFRLYNHRSYSLIRVLDYIIIIGSIICCLAYIVDRKK